MGSELGTLWPPSPASREHRKHLVGKGLDRGLQVLLTLGLPFSLPPSQESVHLSTSLPSRSPDRAGLFGPRLPPRQLLVTQPACGHDGLVPAALTTSLLPCCRAYGSKEVAPAFS